MKAVVHDRYGPPEVLRVADVARPTPQDHEVLVKVHASTVTRTDCGRRAAKPFFSRVFTGLLRPKQNILGIELAGEAEAVGATVPEFAVGDRAFGVRSGACVETGQKTGNVVLTVNGGGSSRSRKHVEEVPS